MGKSGKIKEVELYQPIRAYFERLGYTVNSEAMHCDVTALKNEVLVVVEMKTRLNLDVILQAVQRQKIADFVYIAVPKDGSLLSTRRWKPICHLLRRLELGLILVSVRKDRSFIEEIIRPVPFDRSKSISYAKKRRNALIHEIHQRHGDYNTGGCTRKKLVTAYRELAIRISVVLQMSGPCSVKKIKEIGNLPEKTGRILIDNHYGWFERVGRGVYTLTERAQDDLKVYDELVDYYRKQRMVDRIND